MLIKYPLPIPLTAALVPARHTLFPGQKPVQEWLKELERVKVRLTGLGDLAEQCHLRPGYWVLCPPPHCGHRSSIHHDALSPLEVLVSTSHRQEDALAHPSKPRLTLQDVADRAMDSSFRGRLVPTSPRSIDACLRLGIDPASLRHIPLEAYAKWERDPELARLAYDSEESLRQARMTVYGSEAEGGALLCAV